MYQSLSTCGLDATLHTMKGMTEQGGMWVPGAAKVRAMQQELVEPLTLHTSEPSKKLLCTDLNP